MVETKIFRPTELAVCFEGMDYVQISYVFRYLEEHSLQGTNNNNQETLFFIINLSRKFIRLQKQNLNSLFNLNKKFI